MCSDSNSTSDRNRVSNNDANSKIIRNTKRMWVRSLGKSKSSKCVGRSLLGVFYRALLWVVSKERSPA